MELTNLWGSFFSRIERLSGKPTAMIKPFGRGGAVGGVARVDFSIAVETRWRCLHRPLIYLPGKTKLVAVST